MSEEEFITNKIEFLSKEDLKEASVEFIDDYIDKLNERIIVIKTDLEYREDTDDWYRSATSALKAHKLALYYAMKRQKELKK